MSVDILIRICYWLHVKRKPGKYVAALYLAQSCSYIIEFDPGAFSHLIVIIC